MVLGVFGVIIDVTYYFIDVTQMQLDTRYYNIRSGQIVLLVRIHIIFLCTVDLFSLFIIIQCLELILFIIIQCFKSFC